MTYSYIPFVPLPVDSPFPLSLIPISLLTFCTYLLNHSLHPAQFVLLLTCLSLTCLSIRLQGLIVLKYGSQMYKQASEKYTTHLLFSNLPASSFS
jgi:hypothetical protein